MNLQTVMQFPMQSYSLTLPTRYSWLEVSISPRVVIGQASNYAIN